MPNWWLTFASRRVTSPVVTRRAYSYVVSGYRPASHADAVSGEPLICSAKGCRAPARWALRWNNPKIHPAERRKTWLACDAHREHLAAFLSARGFLRETDPTTTS
jgi:hypothetical protein